MSYQAGALRRKDIEVVIDRRSVYFGVELDNDHLPAPYEHGAWNELLGEVLVEFGSKNPKGFRPIFSELDQLFRFARAPNQYALETTTRSLARSH